MTPAFPLRLIWADGEAEEIATAEELLDRFESFNSRVARDTVWIRDAEDRTVEFIVESGIVRTLRTSSR